ncbi:MAG: hypothetical protein AAF843_12265 [Bacteroidota bacterium]
MLSFLTCLLLLLTNERQMDQPPVIINLVAGDPVQYKLQLEECFDTLQAEHLIIRVIENTGWAVYSMNLDDSGFTPAFSHSMPLETLPENVAKVKTLKRLSISGLGLHTLPESLLQLPNLQVLDVSFNRLDLSRELPLFQKMTALTALNVHSNKMDHTLIEKVKKALPNVKVTMTLEETEDFRASYAEPKVGEDILRKKEQHLIALVDTINVHYPIGKGISNDSFPGFEKVLSTAERIRFLNHPLFKNQQDLIKDLKAQEIGVHVFAPGEQYNIGLQVMIISESREFTDISIDTYFTVSFSALCKYYTISIQKRARPMEHLNLDIIDYELFPMVPHNIEFASKDEILLFNSIIRTTKKHFPNYQYVRFDPLISKNVGPGVPYSDMTRKEKGDHPVYSYLFDSSWNSR